MEDLAGDLPRDEEETVGVRIKRRFVSIENNLVEEIRAVASTGIADGRLVAVALTQIELAFLALGKALTKGVQAPAEPPVSRITPSPSDQDKARG